MQVERARHIILEASLNRNFAKRYIEYVLNVIRCQLFDLRIEALRRLGPIEFWPMESRNERRLELPPRPVAPKRNLSENSQPQIVAAATGKLVAAWYRKRRIQRRGVIPPSAKHRLEAGPERLMLDGIRTLDERVLHRDA